MNTNGNHDDTRDLTDSRMITQIDERTEENIKEYADKSVAEITDRIHTLEQQWDAERALEMGAGSLTIAGLALAAAVDRKWLLMSGVATTLLVWHSLKGTSPVSPLFRRAGIRTRIEIDREIYALKALRGDFQKVHKKRSRPQAHVTKAIDAVSTEPEITAEGLGEAPPHRTQERPFPEGEGGEMTPAPGI